MNKEDLIEHLTVADPGWTVWASLVDLVRSLDFTLTSDEYLGDFIASGTRLSFGILPDDRHMPEFAPLYVSALFDMKADDPETAGGYACCLNFQEVAKRGALFSPAGNDADMGYPVFDPPPDTYRFQTNRSGAVMFLNRDLEVVCPNSASKSFTVLDTLDTFTQVCIQHVLDEEDWFVAYADRAIDLVD